MLASQANRALAPTPRLQRQSVASPCRGLRPSPLIMSPSRASNKCSLDPLRDRGFVKKEKASSLSLSLQLMLSYPVKVAAKSYPPRYTVPKFQKFDGQMSDSNEHVVSFLDSIGAFNHDTTICLKGVFDPLSLHMVCQSIARISA